MHLSKQLLIPCNVRALCFLKGASNTGGKPRWEPSFERQEAKLVRLSTSAMFECYRCHWFAMSKSSTLLYDCRCMDGYVFNVTPFALP